MALGLFDDAIASATAVISQGTYKLMTSRFGVDASNAVKNVIWDLHRPDNKSSGVNTEGLFLVTDRLGAANAFISSQLDGGTGGTSGSRLMRQTAPGVSIGTTIFTPAGAAGMTASSGVELYNVMILCVDGSLGLITKCIYLILRTLLCRVVTQTGMYSA